MIAADGGKSTRGTVNYLHTRGTEGSLNKDAVAAVAPPRIDTTPPTCSA
jgi:hypothetical protein